MTKLLENKQLIIHVATEVIIIAGVVFYFSYKNKKLLQRIENLSQRLEEQDELLKKHEQIIKHLVKSINSRPSMTQQVQKPIQSSIKEQNNSVQIKSPVLKKKTLKILPKIVEINETEPINKTETINEDEPINETETINEDEEQSEEYSSENDSDLDAEIADELNELEDEDNLKKRT